MRFRHSGRKAARVHCFQKRNRSKSGQNPSPVTIGNANRPKAGPKTSWVRGSFEPLYLQIGRKALPLYRLLRRTDHFEWTDAATAGLEEIKNLLSNNPILAAPNIGDP